MSTCSDTNYSFFISSIGFDFVELWTPTSTSTELQTQLQLQQLQQLSNSYICSDIITSSTNNNETSSETSSQKSSTGNNDNCTISKKLIALLSAQDNADYLFVTVADVFPEDFNCVHFDYACIVRIQRSFNCNEAVYRIGFSDCDSHDHQYQAKQLMQLCCQLIDNKYDGNDNSIINTSSNDNSTCMNNSNCHKSCSSPKEKRKRSNSLIESSKQFVSSFFTRQSRSNTLSGSNDECKSNNNSNNTSMSWNYGNRSPKSISDITDSSMTPRSSTDTVSHSLIRPVTIHKKDNLELLLDYNNDNFSNKKKEKILCNDYKSFGYNMKDAKIVNNVSEIMISSFSDVEHYGCGGNADIYTATFTTENGNRTKVIIKMIKKIHVHNKLIAKEFEDELDILLRVQHKSIIKILGYGETPRKFIVLEFLANGTINTLLDDAKNKSYLYTKSPFTYRQVLEYGRDLAEGFDYLHRLWNENATILHRDLKPDNVGFAADGSIRLFDFGLSTCVKKRQYCTQQYKMTKCTGSLRYMAPEVALGKPYSEKVDVFSYSMVLWQMAKGIQPFCEIHQKNEFLNTIIKNDERPQVDKQWPKEFSNLLTRCWDTNPEKRPCFKNIVEYLEILLNQ